MASFNKKSNFSDKNWLFTTVCRASFEIREVTKCDLWGRSRPQSPPEAVLQVAAESFGLRVIQYIKRKEKNFCAFFTWNMTCSWHSSNCVVIMLDMYAVIVVHKWCAQNLRLRRFLLKTRFAWKLKYIFSISRGDWIVLCKI